MSELAEAIARLEQAVARLEAAADPAGRAARDREIAEVAAALAIADELSDANDALEQERSAALSSAAEPDNATQASAASGLDDITRRIEAIAARLDTP